MASSSSSAAYFQGGDFVELLSAQGKAPAATWKLQGKILKSFEKSIKGNAFQLDGSAETKMQLPKTATAQSLGLAQRFLVFQLAIPFTRSFAIEVGFSDFQKIRRRFVFASAFRETAMTSLHVQIPFDARVTRDQWINLVFDLQALTETCFPGSTFRSMESICISGSCKLKRIFTTKDAPSCDPASFEHKLRVGDKQSQRVVLPASYADMKDIPKQFVFSSGAGPIPTEYFVLTSTSSDPRDTAAAASVGSANSGAMSRTGLSSQSGRKSAPPPPSRAARQKSPAATKTNSSRPASSAVARARAPSRSGLQAHSSPRASTPTRSSRVSEDVYNGVRPSSSATARSVKSPTNSPERPKTARSVRSRLSTSEVSDDRPQTSARPSSSSGHGDMLRRQQQKRYEARDRVSSSSSEEFSSSEEEREQRLAPRKSSGLDTMTTPLPATSTVAAVQTESAVEPRASKELHRRSIIAAIQEKLDILSDDDELEAERNSRLFLQHTSILTPAFPDDSPHAFPPGDAKDHRVRDSVASNTSQSSQHSRADSKPHPAAMSKPALESIFSFASSRDSTGAYQPSAKSMKALFDFDSLLASPGKESIQLTTRSSDTPRIELEDIKDDTAIEMDARALGSRPVDDDDDDRALEELLLAKRKARRSAFEAVQRTTTNARPRLSLEDLVVATYDVQGEETKVEEEQDLGGESEAQPVLESLTEYQASTIKDHRSPVTEECNCNDPASDEDDNLSIDL